MVTVRPTRAAATWTTENSLAIEKVYDQLIYPHKYATPTMRILLSRAKRDQLGPDMKFGWNVIYKHLSPSMASKDQRFEAPGIDNLTRLEYEPTLMYNSAGTNDITMALYDSDHARLDHVNLMVDSMHQGYTDAFSYGLFSDWNETISAAWEIDIETEMAASPIPPEGLLLKNVQAHRDRMFSLPMLIRRHATGHTLGGMSSATTWWRPTVTNHPLAVVTPSVAGDNIDAVIAVANAQPIDLDDIAEHLDSVQLGWHYGLMAPCPSAIYRQLRALLLAITRRDIASPLGELGIRAAIEWEEYNVSFYKEPMMTWLYPDSIFYFDPDVYFLLSDSRFDPTSGSGIYPWERISGSTKQATAMYHIVQFVTPERRGGSAMHGYTNS